MLRLINHQSFWPQRKHRQPIRRRQRNTAVVLKNSRCHDRHHLSFVLQGNRRGCRHRHFKPCVAAVTPAIGDGERTKPPHNMRIDPNQPKHVFCSRWRNRHVHGCQDGAVPSVAQLHSNVASVLSKDKEPIVHALNHCG
jgi:hypothetical protein